MHDTAKIKGLEDALRDANSAVEHLRLEARRA
jgi:hypothetical protein